MSHIYPAVAFNSFRRIFGNGIFEIMGEAYIPFLYGLVVLLAYWLVLFFSIGSASLYGYKVHSSTTMYRKT